MSNVEIFNDNFLTDELLVGTTFSSAKTGFPITNLTDFQRRSKVWRSDGYWLITSLNNKIVFQEVSGVNLTASIAQAAYASTTAFLAAIKAAMESAGTKIYTVSIDASTGKIKIATSFSFLSLICTNVNFIAASILGFSTSTDRTGSTSYIADSLKIATQEWLRWDLGTAHAPEAFLFVGDRNKDIQLSPGATLTLQANITDLWSAPLFSQVIPYNRHIVQLVNLNGLVAPTGYRYWRLQIDDQSNINGYVEIGCVFLGTIWTPAQGTMQFPLSIKPTDYSDVAFAEGGHPLVTRRPKTQSYDLKWSFLTTQDTEDLFDIWEKFGKTDPFFVNLDPKTAFTNDPSKNFKMVRFDQEPSFDLTEPGLWDCTMTVREEL